MSTTIESLELEIVANSKSAVSGIEALSNSLGKLKSATKNLGLKNVSNDIKGIGKAAKEVKNASSSFTDLFHKIKSFANIIGNVGKKVWSTVEKSMDYTENMNLFKVSLGEYATEAYETAEKVSDAMGIDTSEWIRAEGVFMTMATGFGIAGDRAYTMSENLTQLGYDLSSFYNMDVDTAMQKLKSGLAGELEPLRAIGYDLSQAKLEATALELGISKSVSAMTQAEKAQLRYYAIMTQVTEVHGDMARTLDDPANQVRVFKAQLNMAAREIGNIFIPALTKILPYAIAVAKVIGNVASSIAMLFGYKKEGVGDTTDKLSESTETMAENLSDAQEEAKKLKSYMLGIDELNVINPNADAEDTSGWVDFDLPTYDFLDGLVESNVNSIVTKMKEWLGITDEIKSWSDLLETRFGNILVTVGLIGGSLLAWKVGEGVVSFISNFDKFATGLKIIGAAAIISAALGGAVWLVKNTDTTIEKIGAIVSGALLAVGAILAFTGNLPLGIGLMVAGAVSMGTAIAMNTDKLSDDVKGVIAVITSTVSVALLAVGAILAFTGASIPLGIALMLGGAVTMGTAILPNWNNLSDSVKRTISDILAMVGVASLAVGAILAFSGVGLPLGISLMALGAASLATTAALNWNAIIDSLRGPLGKIVTTISASLIALGGLLLLSGVGIPLGLSLLAAGAVGLVTMIAVNWNSVGNTLKTALATIGGIIAGSMLILGVLLLMSGAGIGVGLALIFAGLAGSYAAWKLDDNPVTRFLKNMLNAIISVVNEVITFVNEVVSAVTFGAVTIPLIPLLADGGFPETGQMFIAREAGAEMVGNIGRRTAVANNDQIVSGIAGGVAEANEEQNALLREQNSLLRAILDKDSGVYLDGRNLTNSVEKYQRERGRVLIKGGVI